MALSPMAGGGAGTAVACWDLGWAPGRRPRVGGLRRDAPGGSSPMAVVAAAGRRPEEQLAAGVTPIAADPTPLAARPRLVVIDRVWRLSPLAAILSLGFASDGLAAAASSTWLRRCGDLLFCWSWSACCPGARAVACWLS